MNQLPRIRDAVAAIKRCELTPVDLVEHCLARINQFDDRIHAWVSLDQDGARREAERLTQLAARGEIVGPLHGVPIGVKDIIDVAGMTTKAGSPLREGVPSAMHDAPVIANLRVAGAIILGKTVTTEWACFDPPLTRNPWNLQHTPGGSSSGSAAAVAMEMCAAALGTQTGGSISRPAAYCGVCGLKPSYQPEMMEGIVPVSFHLDHVGPLARGADDLDIVRAAMMGRETPPPHAEPPKALQLLRPFFLDEADDEVRGIFEAALGRLSSQMRIENDFTLPDAFAAVRQHHWRIMAVEAAAVHRRQFAATPERFGPKVASLIREGLATSAVDYADSLDHQRRLRLEMMRRRDPCMITPATPSTAPGLDTTGDAKFNAPWSYLGLPTTIIPCGTARNGLPVGLQVVGHYGGERELLRITRWIEQQIPFDVRPDLS